MSHGAFCPQRHLGEADEGEGKSWTHLVFQWCLWKAAKRTWHSTFETFCCFFKKRRTFLIMENLESCVQGPLLQDKAQHNAAELGAPWGWEQRRKAGRTEGESRSWLGFNGKALDLSCVKHKAAKPTCASGRASTPQHPSCPRGTLNSGKVQAN